MITTSTKKTILIFILFTSMSFISCQAWNLLKEKSGNIKSIYSEVSLSGEKLQIHNNLTIQANSETNRILRFYLPSGRAMSKLNICNQLGKKLEYNYAKENNIAMIEVTCDTEKEAIVVDYNINLPELKPSISFQQDINQLFLLPETSIFPSNYAKLTPDNIEYTVKAYEDKEKYTYAEQTETIHSSSPPTIIYGNFKIMEENGIKVYIPNGIYINEKALNFTTSSIVNVYNYYTKIYGENMHLRDIKLFFLNRRGGYALPEGIILNQKYISEDTIARNDLIHLVSHEIAHLWWGIRIKTKSWSMAEGLAKFSSDLYQIENERINSKDIYSLKNSSVLDANLKPADIMNLNLFNTKYKAKAYNKLPIIFHEAELKIGRHNLINALRSIYQSKKDSSALFGFREITSHFPAPYQTEIWKDIDGSLKDWPDFYIKSISNNQIVFGGSNINFPEVVPIELTTDQNIVIKDTLHFNIKTSEIARRYESNITKIIIDRDFSTNQSVFLNDFWTKNPRSLLNNKWETKYPPQYHTFFNSLLNYLFTDKKININNIIEEGNKTPLFRAKNKLKNIEVYGAYLKIIKSSHNFKISITLNTKKGVKNGFIEGYFYKKNNILYLKSIKRIKI